MKKRVLAIGKTGALLSSAMNRYGEYEAFSISPDEGADILVPRLSNPEKYEELKIDLGAYKRWLSDADELVCAIGGGDLETALLLRVLEHAKDKSVEVLYVRPDISALSGYGKLHERILFNVLQEYARSGLFSRLWLFSSLAIEEIVGEELSILEYDDIIVDAVARAFCSVDLFRSGKKPSIRSTISEPHDVDRIATIAMVDVKREKQVDLYPLKLIKERELHYAFPTKEVKQNGKTILEIVRHQDNKVTPEEGVPWVVETSYAIYESEFETPFAYAVLYSSEIQEDEQ